MPKLDGFDPHIHVKVSDVKYGEKDCNGLEETVIFIPWTKVAKEKGEKIFWAKQDGIVDPQAALANHLSINKPSKNRHLFVFKHNNGWRPMTRTILITRVNKIANQNGLEKIPAHGLQVGSTLEYLLRGVPFDVVKTKGRWKSDTFLGYLREHALILAPYMQANPTPYDSFV